MSVDHRLATYGTLAPGRPNHHHLSALPGTWRSGTVRGTLVARGWGAAMGYPSLDPAGDGVVAVQLFESPALPEHWGRLDAFEGDEYRRAVIRVDTDDGPVDAWIYVDRS